MLHNYYLDYLSQKISNSKSIRFRENPSILYLRTYMQYGHSVIESLLYGRAIVIYLWYNSRRHGIPLAGSMSIYGLGSHGQTELDPSLPHQPRHVSQDGDPAIRRIARIEDAIDVVVHLDV